MGLAACAGRAPVNANPSASFEADRWACLQQLGPMPRTEPPAPRSVETQTTCRRDLMGNYQCESTSEPGPSIGSRNHALETMAKLQAQRDRDAALRGCLMSKGWR